MTVTEALLRTKQLMDTNQDTKSTMHGVIDARTIEAIAKLRQVAHEATFGRRTK